MTEKDFANMPLEELEAYCTNLECQLTKAHRFLRSHSEDKKSKSYYEDIKKELDTARWFFRNRRMTASERIFSNT